MMHMNLKAALLALAAFGVPCATNAEGFNQFVGIGDSTLDSGYFRFHTIDNGGPYDRAVAAAVAAGAKGGFAGSGTMDSVILAEKFGLSGLPIGFGGYNYANGNSHTLSDPLPNVAAVRQIDNYLADVNGAANPNALFVISSGNNDLIYVTNQGAAWRAANPHYLGNVAASFASKIAVLQSHGARAIIVPNSYFSAVMARLGGDIDPARADEYARSRAFSTALWSDLTAAGVNFIPADMDSVFSYVVHNPTSFGMTATSVLAASAPCRGTPALICSSMTPEQMQAFLFIDGNHVTTAGQEIEADYMYNLVTAPSQISLIGESAIQSGLNRANVIQGQIDLSARRRGSNRLNAWISAGADTLKNDNVSGFPNASGKPFQGTLGFDYRLFDGAVVGAAFSVGRQKQDFSTGGHFDQTVEAPSLYAAYRQGWFWGSAIMTYGFFQEKITRDVKLGTFIDRNVGDTTGRSLAFAVHGGGDFDVGHAIKTGPVVGFVAQRMRLDGYTETGTSGTTSLSFATQKRNSLVSQLGWRGSVELGVWRPFAEVTWNHEWKGKNGRVTASLTSANTASYTTDAAPVAADWGTASLGATYQLNERLALRGGASCLFLNDHVVSYGGELGLSLSF